MNKTLRASDIKWVKTVNDRKTNSAYIPPDKPYQRVITNTEGVFFCLQLHPRFTDSLNRVPFGDLILLYQNLDQSTLWQSTEFTGDYQDLRFRTGRIWEIPQTPHVPNLQQDLWNRFQPFML